MNSVITTVAPPAQVLARPGPGRGARLRLSWRLIRRSAVLMWLAIATYMAIEVVSFRTAYPDQASRQRLLDLSSSTAVRMLEGVPSAVNTAGGFAVWDGGWMVTLIVASWAMLTVARLTRGEEDAGRLELVLSHPVSPRQALLAHLGAMTVALAGVGAAAAIPFVVLGEPASGALLWGAGITALGTVITCLASVCAQLVEPRRRVTSLGLGLIAGAFLVRVVANSADDRAWLLTLTPFGWLDRLRAFGTNAWLWLAPPLLLAIVLGCAAVLLCARRDSGTAVLRTAAQRRSRLHLLGGANAFGWRLSSGALIAWTLTIAVSSLVFGLMTPAVVEFITKDATYRKILGSMGMDTSVPVVGFLSYIAVFMALPFVCFVGWRIGAVRQEEADGRLDNLLVRGVVRWRWLTITGALALLAAAILMTACAVGLWAGARLADVRVTAWQVLEPIAGTLPLIVLFTGISVLAFGVAPRLTVALPVTLAVLSYLLDTFGSMLSWPDRLTAVSPFHHLARLPAAPMTATALVTMLAVGIITGGVGVIAFSRRDLHGA